MNRRQKEVIQASLEDEIGVIRKLEKAYRQASKDCEDAISALNARKDMQNLQSIIYQKQYQKTLKNQIDGILNQLQTNEFLSIAEYLTTCYENGYIGAMYDLQGQGIPITVPIDQNKVVKAVETDSQISTTMYERLGEDVEKLKKNITSELSRGTVSGKGWLEMATNIANGMNSPFKKARNNAIRIARTEGHRIQQSAQLDSITEAKDKGADVVKQWDATLDGRTRPEHQKLDGQIREVDEEFEVDGYTAMMPGGFGDPYMDCNCRCYMLQRAKWSLDEDELETLKERAEYFGLDKTNDFEEYKQRYLNVTDDSDTINLNQFNSRSDPMVEVTGAGEISNPKEIASIRNELKDLGVPLIEREKENLAYAPGISSGQPGMVYISKGASYSAWCHEMQHVRDDYAAGWSGMRILEYPDMRYAREVNAYNVEIELAKQAGREDIVERLIENLEAERKAIYGEE